MSKESKEINKIKKEYGKYLCLKCVYSCIHKKTLCWNCYYNSHFEDMIIINDNIKYIMPSKDVQLIQPEHFGYILFYNYEQATYNLLNVFDLDDYYEKIKHIINGYLYLKKKYYTLTKLNIEKKEYIEYIKNKLIKKKYNWNNSSKMIENV